MTALEAALRSVAQTLVELHRPFALIGGLAVSARAEPRFTRDVDLVVVVAGDRDAEALVFALRGHGYEVLATVEQEATGRLATIRLAAPGDASGVVVDLLFASSGVEPEIVQGAQPLQILPGLVLPVARVGHLMATKLLARDDVRRPQDIADLRALLREADATEVTCAREAVTLIESRGYARGRDLLAALDALLAEPAPQ